MSAFLPSWAADANREVYHFLVYPSVWDHHSHECLPHTCGGQKTSHRSAMWVLGFKVRSLDQAASVSLPAESPLQPQSFKILLPKQS